MDTENMNKSEITPWEFFFNTKRKYNKNDFLSKYAEYVNTNMIKNV